MVTTLSSNQDAPVGTSVAERIIAQAQALGIPKRGLSAKLAAICVVSDKAAYKWLTGDSIPTKDNMDKLARALGSTSTYLTFGDRANLENVAEPLPLPLSMILQSFRSGAIDECDLELLSGMSELLAKKNAQHS